MIYLPYQDFRRSAKCLSDDHLREQRNSIRTAIRTLTVPRSGPMDDWIAEWSGHVTQLLQVCDATLEERRRRKLDERGMTPWMLDHGDYPPDWLGNAFYHDAVRRQLLHLNPAHYARMEWRLLDENAATAIQGSAEAADQGSRGDAEEATA